MPSSGQGTERDVVTLMYLPSETGRIRRYRVARTWLRRGAASLCVMALAITVLGVDYVRVRVQVTELARLRAETEEQRGQILAYSQQMEDIVGRLERISNLDRKLRVITSLDPASPLPLPGIGGIEDTLEPHQLARATRSSRHRRMTEMLGQISEAADAEAGSLEQLIEHLDRESGRLVATPSISPAHGWVTSIFGSRTSPFTGAREFHKGLDIAGRLNTPVVSPADGDVVFAGVRNHLGSAVVLRHGYGIETLYGHLAAIEVKVGDKIKRGQRLGLLGNTGRSTGPHLHYQVQVNGTPVDPRNYILD